MLQNTVLCTLASSTKLGLNAVLIAAGQNLCSDFTFSTKHWSCLEIRYIFHEVKRKEKLSHNLGQNICKIFHVLAQLLFTKSKLELDFTTKMWICELSHELSNNLRLQKLENYKKIPDMLGFDGKFSADYPKAKFWRLWQNPRILCPRFQINIYLLTYLFTYLS